MTYNDGNILIETEPGVTLDCEEISRCLQCLDVNSPCPAGANPVGTVNKWGQATFTTSGVFIKARYECNEANRHVPFCCIADEERAIRRAMLIGIPTPSLLGKLAVKEDGSWRWSGIINDLLVGYSQPDESDKGVSVMLAAIDMLRNGGAVHNDMHSGNVLYRDGDIRIVDLVGLSTCTKGDRNAAAVMAHMYMDTLESYKAKEIVSSYVHGL